MPTPTLQDARDLLKSAFGYEKFRPGQEAAVSAILSGRDTVVVLPTGGGKSLCFQVPALLMPGLTVVVSPLISLMKDQVDALTAKGLPAAFINSTLTSGQVSDRLARVDRGEIKLLYVAPERFDFGRTAERLRRIGVSLLAIDEAHCISQWGHDFRPSYLRVKDVHEQLGSPTTIALTATATPEVRRDIIRELALREPETIITGFDRPNLTYFVVPVKNDAEKERRLAEILRKYEGLAVIYASTRKAVDHLTTVLERAKIAAAGYHAGLDDSRRRQVQEAFMSEKIRAIVATNAFGMGIDKPNVRLVIHYTMPGTLEAYYQEAGRAGRDGQHSDVFLLHAFPDRFTHEFFIKGSYPERTVVEQTYDALRALSDKQGFASAQPEDLLRAVKSKASTREIEGAIRILERSGALTLSNGDQARVHVRLLATPERVKRELTGEANAELGLLRALWRGVGPALRTGAVVDLDGLPPGLGGSSSLRTAARRAPGPTIPGVGAARKPASTSPTRARLSRSSGSIGRSSTVVVPPSSPSFRRFRNTPTPRSAGVASCSATLATPLPGRAAPAVTTASGSLPWRQSKRMLRALHALGKGRRERGPVRLKWPTTW